MNTIVNSEKTSSEAHTRKVHKLVLAGYAAASILIMIVYIILDMPYFYWQSVGTLFILPLLWGVYRMLGMRPVHRLDIVVVCYTFLAYTIGVVLRAYKVIPFYDKLMHMMSGTLTMMLAYPVFYLLKPNHTVERRDFPLAAIFCLCAAIAFAGLWEIGEYIICLLTGIDTQVVQTAGIHDTMQDMIVCTIGALAFLPFMGEVFHKKPARLFMVPSDDFIQICPLTQGMALEDAA